MLQASRQLECAGEEHKVNSEYLVLGFTIAISADYQVPLGGRGLDLKLQAGGPGVQLEYGSCPKCRGE